MHRLWHVTFSGHCRAFAAKARNGATVALSSCGDGIAACPPYGGCSLHIRAVAMTVLQCDPSACTPEHINRACKHATATDGHRSLGCCQRTGCIDGVAACTSVDVCSLHTRAATTDTAFDSSCNDGIARQPRRHAYLSKPTVLLSTPRRLMAIGHSVVDTDPQQTKPKP